MPAHEPIIDVQDLTREFTVRRKGAGRRRTRTTLAAVDRMTFRCSRASRWATSGPTAPGSRPPSRCSPASSCRPPARCARAGWSRCAGGASSPAASASSSASAASCGGTCRCASRSRILAAIHRLARRRRGPHAPSWSTQLEMGAAAWTPRCASCRSASGCAARSRPRCCTPRELLDPGRADHRAGRPEQGAAARVPAPSERASRGTTLLLTTHDMGDIERLCDRVLVVDHGRLAYDGTLPGLAATGRRAPGAGRRPGRAPPDLTGIAGAEHLVAARAGGCASGWPSTPGRHDGRRRCSPRSSARAEVRDLSIEEPDIEDVVTPDLPSGADPAAHSRRPQSRPPPDPSPFRQTRSEAEPSVGAGVRGCAASACCPGCWA